MWVFERNSLQDDLNCVEYAPRLSGAPRKKASPSDGLLLKNLMKTDVWALVGSSCRKLFQKQQVTY